MSYLLSVAGIGTTKSLHQDHTYTKVNVERKGSYGRLEKEGWKTTIGDIEKLIENKCDLIKWLQQIGWINKEYMCPVCNGNMLLKEATSYHKSSDGLIWRCRGTVAGKRHQVERSIRRGSWIENSNLTVEEIVKFTYMWCQKFSGEMVSNITYIIKHIIIIS